jgi:hypothetical protein
MDIRERHGRVGQATEYYEYEIRHPRVWLQRVGAQWLLGVTHTDGALQSLAYYPELADGKRAAARLAQTYASARITGTTTQQPHDIEARMAADVAEDEHDAGRNSLIVDTTGTVGTRRYTPYQEGARA